MKNLIKKVNLKYLHILIIILGILFISLSIFHTNLWFDESYSVGIVRHSFSEIWQISGNDVHPPFYYFCLRILYLIFGNNIIVYRIFSALTIALIGILGYTHIRKDFGEKTGIIFSFLTLFLPMAAQYAREIRMYSLGMLLGTLMAIYAYRIYKNKINKTTYLFFGLSSLLSAYTHYYGLMLAGIINLILFIYLIKNVKERKSDLVKFIIIAVIQIICYLPWLIYFIKQIQTVSSGFWISLSFPGTLYDILAMQYKGNLQFSPVILSTCFYAYIIYLISKTKKEDRKPATWCFYIYIAIILIALLISIIMHSAILLYRYLLITTGLLIFGISYFMAKDTKILRILTICLIILIVSCISNILAINENYEVSNRNWVGYMKEHLQDDDIILYTNAINGATFTTDLSNNLNVKSYFLNNDHWPVDESYKAFSPYMQIIYDLNKILDNYTGRIWLIESENCHDLLDEIDKKYDITKIDEQQFKVRYRDYTYNIELIEM